MAEGTVDIGNSDVEASEKLDETQAAELVDHKVCVITMAPIVNNDVAEAGVTSLTKDQLIGIFTGKITQLERGRRTERGHCPGNQTFFFRNPRNLPEICSGWHEEASTLPWRQMIPAFFCRT